MKRVDVFTQADLDRVTAAGDIAVCRDGRFVAGGISRVVAWGISHVVARGSSHVVAWDRSHVEALDSSHVVAWGISHVVAWDRSHVVAWDSSHIEALGRSHVEAWDSSHVEAGRYVAVHKLSQRATIDGGVLIVPKDAESPSDWCDINRVSVVGGVATLYKAVRDDYRSSRGMSYAPGTAPEAPDWDGGVAECGGGFHFCAHPAIAKSFDDQATRFMACPVALEDMAVTNSPAYPQKIKARRVCGPCVEVDLMRKPIGGAS